MQGTYKSVTATITVPALKPGGVLGVLPSYGASAWVGIDGDSCPNAILQTGIDLKVTTVLGLNPTTTYDGAFNLSCCDSRCSFAPTFFFFCTAWYEWYPANTIDFTGISFSAGDSVTATVELTSKTGGTATIKNNSKGTSVTKKV